jgi:SAM-dependent methyltransferase
MFELFLRVFHPSEETKVLDVGVTCDTSHPESNYFEKMYPYPSRIVCVGVEDGSHLEREYPGLRYIRVIPGMPLPFGNDEFDIVFSNAVIEHVGSRQSQTRFANELIRVGKQFFITTPNRWFPVEHHTGLPLLHFLPPPLFRRLIRNTAYGRWASEENLNLLTASSFAALFPASVNTTVKKIRLFGLTSNLVAYGAKIMSSSRQQAQEQRGVYVPEENPVEDRAR